jgi:hypothetical protein
MLAEALANMSHNPVANALEGLGFAFYNEHAEGSRLDSRRLTRPSLSLVHYCRALGRPCRKQPAIVDLHRPATVAQAFDAHVGAEDEMLKKDYELAQ